MSAILVGAGIGGTAAASDSPIGTVAAAPNEMSALTAAQRQGSPVEVTGLTNEYQQVAANPDGTFTARISLLPVRAKRGQNWVDIDTTLEHRADGTVGPRAAVLDLALSGGGDNRLVRLTRNGQSLEMTWPTALPAPRLTGDTATYPDVLPDIDLRIIARSTGISYALIVKSRKAASNPALKRLKMGLTAPGLTVRAEKSGALAAVDKSGKSIFTAPAAAMWDSPAVLAKRTGVQEADDAMFSRPSTLGRVGVEVSRDALVLVPDQSLLVGSDTAYPVVIDPDWTWAESGQAPAWTFTWDHSKTSNYLNTRSWPGETQSATDTYGLAKVGKSPGTDEAGGSIVHSYFMFPVNHLRGAKINGAHFKIRQTWKHYNSCTVYPVTQLRVTEPISTGTTWNTEPEIRSGTFLTNSSSAKYNYCPASNPKAGELADYDVTTWVQSAADPKPGNNYPYDDTGRITLRMSAADENSVDGWKRFANKAGAYPDLTVNYNFAPNTPDTLSETGAQWCGYCGGKGYIGGAAVTLNARLFDPDKGEDTVSASWDITSARGHSTVAGTAVVSGNGGMVSTSYSLSGLDGTEMSWKVRAKDAAGALSDFTATRTLVVDQTPPRPPTVQSPDYPANQWAGRPGKLGRFTFSANDTTPDVDHYLYGWTDPPSTKVVATNAVGGGAAVEAAPPVDGPVTLFVQAVDRAGNRSEVAPYRLYVHADPNAADKLNGYWKLDDLTDSANAGHTLQLVGSASVVTEGKDHKALRPGNGGASTSNTLRTDESFTVSAWVMLDSLATGGVAVSQAGVYNSGFYLSYDNSPGYPDAGYRWRFQSPSTDNSSYSWQAMAQPDAAAPSPQAGRWTHLTGVYDKGIQQIRLYVDGVQIATAPRTAVWNAAGTFEIGRALHRGSMASPFPGTIDEVRAYQRVLSAAEIRKLSGVDAGTVGAWPMDGNANATVGRNLQPVGNPGYGDGHGDNTSALGNKAVLLDGSTQYLNTSGAVLHTHQSFSVSAWVKPTTMTAGSWAVSQTGNSNSAFFLGYDVAYSPTGGRWRFQLPTADGTSHGWSIVASTEQIPTPTNLKDRWTHLLGVVDVPAKRIRLYVNGIYAGQSEFLNPWDAQSTDGLVVGRAKVRGAWTGMWNGAIDDVRVWQSALTTADARTLAGLDPGLFGQWQLNGVATDLTGVHPATVPASGVTWSPDGKNAVLDGTSSLATPGPGATTMDGFTVSAWVQPTSASGYRAAVSQDGRVNSGFTLGYNHTSGKWRFGMSDRDSATGETVWTDIEALVDPLAGWTHLTGIYDARAGLIFLYVDGRFAGFKTFRATWNADGGVRIGAGKRGGEITDVWTGSIDDVRVHSGALSQLAIESQFTGGRQ